MVKHYGDNKSRKLFRASPLKWKGIQYYNNCVACVSNHGIELFIYTEEYLNYATNAYAWKKIPKWNLYVQVGDKFRDWYKHVLKNDTGIYEVIPTNWEFRSHTQAGLFGVN